MGHFTHTVTATGKNRREAERNAIDRVLREEGTRHDYRDTERAAFVKKVPPLKAVRRQRPRFDYRTGRQVMDTIITSEPDPNAPEAEWLEEWEFDIHTHA